MLCICLAWEQAVPDALKQNRQAAGAQQHSVLTRGQPTAACSQAAPAKILAHCHNRTWAIPTLHCGWCLPPAWAVPTFSVDGACLHQCQAACGRSTFRLQRSEPVLSLSSEPVGRLPVNCWRAETVTLQVPAEDGHRYAASAAGQWGWQYSAVWPGSPAGQRQHPRDALL